MKKSKRVKELKDLIEYNYNLELFLDHNNVIWIDYNKLRIDINLIEKYYYVGFHGYKDDKKIQEHIIVDCDESVLYLLYKYCKDVHKWGEFKN